MNKLLLSLATVVLLAGASVLSTTTTSASDQTCKNPSTVQNLEFSSSRWPNIAKHTLAAIKRGWPKVLIINRVGLDERRARLLRDIPTKPGYDRDEYPPASARGRARGSLKGLVRGTNPTGWMADVDYVPSRENRSQGASYGLKIRPFCDGVKIKYVFTP